MTMSQKLTLSILTAFIGGTGAYYEAHDTKDLVMNAHFWVGMFFAGVVPIGGYFMGLVQRGWWEPPTLPTSNTMTGVSVTGLTPMPPTQTPPPPPPPIRGGLGGSLTVSLPIGHSTGLTPSEQYPKPIGPQNRPGE